MSNEITQVLNDKGLYNPTTNPEGVTFQTILEYMGKNHPGEIVNYDGEPVGLGLIIELEGLGREERFILEPISGSGEGYTSTGFLKQATVYLWQGQLLNEQNIEADNFHISAPIPFITSEPLTPLPFKVRPTAETETVKVGILPTLDINGIPQFPLHFGAVTHKIIHPNLVELKFSIDDQENKMGELVLHLKSTYKPITEYSLFPF